MSSGQTYLEQLAACLEEPPQKLLSTIRERARRIACGMIPPGRIVDGQDLDKMMEIISQAVLASCGRNQPDLCRSPTALANAFYSQAQDLIWPPNQDRQIPAGFIAMAKRMYAEAALADEREVSDLAEALQRGADRVRRQ